MNTMNKVDLRYLFEIFIIYVTISFYIQGLLDEREEIVLKNAGLLGALIDLDLDRIIFNNIAFTVKSREASIFSIFRGRSKYQ